MKGALPEFPIVPAYGYDGSIVFQCPFCNRVHWHGSASISVGAVEKRAAHCLPGSPLSGKGYSLLVVGELSSFQVPPRCDAQALADLNAQVTLR